MSRPLPILSNMPWNVKQDIVNNLDCMSRLSVRKCSKDLRGIIDKSRVDYPQLLFFIGDNVVKLCFANRKIDQKENLKNVITYIGGTKGSCRVRYARRGKDWEKRVPGEHFIQRAVSDVATYLKSPRSSMNCLTLMKASSKPIEMNIMMLFACLKRTLAKIPHQLNISRIHFHLPVNQIEILHVLPLLKPGTLKIINIKNKTVEMEELVVTDQWKMAEQVALVNESNVRIQDFLHLRYFDTSNYRLVPEELELLIQTFLSQPHKILHYRIRLPQNYDLALLREWLNDNQALVQGSNPIVWHAKIPGTEFHAYMFLKITEFQIYRVLSTSLEQL